MAIGFMSICKDVNVDLLNRCFELGPFHGLRVPHPDDVMQPMLSEPNIVANDDYVDGNNEFNEGNNAILS